RPGPNAELDIVNSNRELYNALTTKDTFSRKNPLDTINKIGALYCAPFLVDMINELYFSEKHKSEALKFADDHVPLPTIALSLTAYECTLNEWKLGYHEDVKFTAKLLINNAEQLQQDLYEAGRSQTQLGMKTIVTKSTTSFSIADFAANSGILGPSAPAVAHYTAAGMLSLGSSQIFTESSNGPHSQSYSGGAQTQTQTQTQGSDGLPM
ncbi:hypothetical protein BT96DRAFT_995996, partial [Gymnopus androsaceus JB14]